jgi:hypothetical protein
MNEKGILSSPNINQNRMLCLAAAKMVKPFYVSDEVRRIVLRIEDYV